MAGRLAALLLLQAGAAASGLTVATLSDHDPTAWTKDSGCSAADDRGLVGCNLRVFSAAVAIAAASPTPVDVVLFPEGYALAGGADKSTFLEPLTFTVADNPCTAAGGNTTATSTPQLTGLSCLARGHKLAIAANVFTKDPTTGDGHITEVVFDSAGAVAALYDKHHLFLTENAEFKPGPFKPTVFDLPLPAGGPDSVRVGLIICWEGFYPSVTGDWSQLEAFKSQNASVVLWSIGTSVEFIKDVSMDKTAALWATKYNFSVAATVDEKPGVAFNAGGAAAAQVAVTPVAGVDGYNAKGASVSIFSMTV